MGNVTNQDMAQITGGEVADAVEAEDLVCYFSKYFFSCQYHRCSIAQRFPCPCRCRESGRGRGRGHFDGYGPPPHNMAPYGAPAPPAQPYYHPYGPPPPPSVQPPYGFHE